MATWNGSEAHRAAQARYRRTAVGRRVDAESNTRRIYVGERYHGRAQTSEVAAVIRSHIKERIRAFITR